MTQNRFNNEIIDFIYNIDVLPYFSTSLQCGIGFTNYQKKIDIVLIPRLPMLPSLGII